MPILFLLLAALAAGAVNAIAGGGTIFTFSALSVLVDPVTANTTSTVTLVPGSLASAWGYRREMHEVRRWAVLLVLPSLLGGLLGAELLIRLGERFFARLVPWLILAAVLLLLAQPAITRLLGIGKEHKPPRPAGYGALVAFQFLVGVYGGYFGAGIGILMLGALSLMGLSDIHRMNALKSFLAVFINGVAVADFVLRGRVNWPYVALMAPAAIAGGYLGAALARRLNRNLVRGLVIAIGFALAAYYFMQQWQASGSS